MFIIVPLIIIFLLFSYLQLNEITLFAQIFIYSLMLGVVLLSYYLFKKVRGDYKIQQQNTIKQEIAMLEIKLSKTDDPNIKKSYLHKIDMLYKELED